MKTQDLKELSKFSITKVIENTLLEDNSNNINKMLDLVDLLEVCEKEYRYNFKGVGLEFVKIKESIMLNIVQNVDFKLYKKIMNPTWLIMESENQSNHSKIMSHYVYFNKYEEINFFLDMGLDFLISKDKNIDISMLKDFQKENFNACFTANFKNALKILLANENPFKHSEKTIIEEEEKIFYKAIDCFSIFYEIFIDEGFHKRPKDLGPIDKKNWFLKWSKIQSAVNSNSADNNFIKMVFRSDKIFFDAYNQRKDRITNKTTNPFIDNDFIIEAIFKEKTNIVDFLFEKHGDNINKKEIINLFNIRLKELVTNTEVEKEESREEFDRYVNKVIDIMVEKTDYKLNDFKMLDILLGKVKDKKIIEKNNIDFNVDVMKVYNQNEELGLSIKDIYASLYLFNKIKHHVPIEIREKTIESSFKKHIYKTYQSLFKNLEGVIDIKDAINWDKKYAYIIFIEEGILRGVSAVDYRNFIMNLEKYLDKEKDLMLMSNTISTEDIKIVRKQKI